jgi:hypothetical protein
MIASPWSGDQDSSELSGLPSRSSPSGGEVRRFESCWGHFLILTADQQKQALLTADTLAAVHFADGETAARAINSATSC